MPDGSKKISVYSGHRTKRGVTEAIAMIVKEFPGWSKDQSKVLQDRFADNGFTDQRMIDAVKHVIDTYEGYGRIPNIANFIQYDKFVDYVDGYEV